MNAEFDVNDSLNDEQVDLIYGELRGIAHALFCGETGFHTLQPTAFLHDCWIELSTRPVPKDQEGRQSWVNWAAWIMRRRLIDYIRRRKTQKRGGGKVESLEALAEAGTQIGMDIVDNEGRFAPVPHFSALHDALDDLAKEKPAWAAILNLEYFFQRDSVSQNESNPPRKPTQQEIGEELGYSAETVRKYKAQALEWLNHRLESISTEL
jgi:RNA polymerase sigma factor (sigma-70 family)